ncbi:MAG: helix-turn-helix transcriptional regulator [Clostridia bacterium]|nr:helix-turn-helix transcriptional regulator [Clostridia bacterium]
MQISESLKQARQKNKMTQAKLAEMLNLSPQSVSKWEKGLSEPSVGDIIKLADIFNMSIDNLLGHKPCSKNAELEINEFLKMLVDKYFGNLTEAEKQIKTYLDKNITTTQSGDKAWGQGGQRLIAAAILYNLNKCNKNYFCLDDVINTLELDIIDENRQQNLIEKFKDSPKQIQRNLSGILDTHNATFRGYVSVAISQLDELKNA